MPPWQQGTRSRQPLKTCTTCLRPLGAFGPRRHAALCSDHTPHLPWRRKPLNRRFIVVEGIYANTGELAPLEGLKALKEVRAPCFPAPRVCWRVWRGFSAERGCLLGLWLWRIVSSSERLLPKRGIRAACMPRGCKCLATSSPCPHSGASSSSLLQRYKYRLIVDESVSLGVLGKQGRGAAEHFGYAPEDVEIVGGSMGALHDECMWILGGCTAHWLMLWLRAGGCGDCGRLHE